MFDARNPPSRANTAIKLSPIRAIRRNRLACSRFVGEAAGQRLWPGATPPVCATWPFPSFVRPLAITGAVLIGPEVFVSAVRDGVATHQCYALQNNPQQVA